MLNKIIAIYGIISSIVVGLSLAIMLATLQQPSSNSMRMLILLLGISIIYLICNIGLLRGGKWALWVLFTFYVLQIVKIGKFALGFSIINMEFLLPVNIAGGIKIDFISLAIAGLLLAGSEQNRAAKQQSNQSQN